MPQLARQNRAKKQSFHSTEHHCLSCGCGEEVLPLGHCVVSRKPAVIYDQLSLRLPPKPQDCLSPESTL